MSTAKIYFYKVYDKDIKFAHKLRKICSLPEAKREYKHKDVHVNVQTHTLTTGEQNYIAGTIRFLRGTASSIGSIGTNKSEPIPLKEGQGVNEKTHFVLKAPEDSDSYIAVEYNHYGPKVSHVFNLINKLYADIFDDECENNSYIYLAKRGGISKVKKSEEIKRVHFEIIEEPTRSISALNPIQSAFNNAFKIGDVQTVEVFLKAKKNSRGSIMRGVEFMKNILPNSTGDINDYTKLKVDFISDIGGLETVDLIKDKLVKQITVLPISRGTKEVNSQKLLSDILEDVKERDFSLYEA